MTSDSMYSIKMFIHSFEASTDVVHIFGQRLVLINSSRLLLVTDDTARHTAHGEDA